MLPLYGDQGQLGEQGQLTRRYVCLADQPLAVIDTSDGRVLSNEELFTEDSYGLEAKNTCIAWWRGATFSLTGSHPEQIDWLHANYVGLPQTTNPRRHCPLPVHQAQSHTEHRAAAVVVDQRVAVA